MKDVTLSEISSPRDLKQLNYNQLNTLCKEIRETIIETVSKNGGHLASSLGAVELTVALHRSFNSPDDSIIFDVGHQSYAHKLLTGRFDRFSTLRQKDGLSGFMRPDESEYDPFVTGHSSNSISAAYGILKANAALGKKSTAIAVIGDGAMTGGMAYEALNNIGAKKGRFIVVLNDNKMSISKNVGAVSRSFMRMRNGKRYHRLKFAVSNVLLKMGCIGKGIYNFITKIKDTARSFVYKNNVFAALGFNCLGPIDGHNISAMESIFEIAKSYNRPTLIHVVTRKGKGYAPSENYPNDYHGVSPFDVDKGVNTEIKTDFSAVAGETLCQTAAENVRICAITAAMTCGTGLSKFAEKFRDRFFDVGIAEEHAVTFSAGLAKGGMIPFFAVYSSFLQRGYDQIIHDAAIAGLPVKLLVDRAGIVGEDGESHQGLFDVAFLRTVPGMNIYSPYCYDELEYRIKETIGNNELAAIRYPRGTEWEKADIDFSCDYTVLSNGSERAVVTYGRLFSCALTAQKQLDSFDIIKLNRIFPVSGEIIGLLNKYKTVDFFEEGIRSGGIGEHIASKLLENKSGCAFTIHAVDGVFVSQQTTAQALSRYGLDTKAIISAMERGV
ncbi:MAG: 1-deoxy-D-xylulose-5-phosphate synthase [Clostridia bacterium]|nr:1-deoxy-D-xylulose-5-phosphate synthase [Clostridia bacterium]